MDFYTKSINARGYYSPNQKLKCFVFHLKIINTLNWYASYNNKLSKELKNSFQVKVGQAFL